MVTSVPSHRGGARWQCTLALQVWVKLTGPGQLCFSVKERPVLQNVRKAVQNTIVVGARPERTTPQGLAFPPKTAKPPRLAWCAGSSPSHAVQPGAMAKTSKPPSTTSAVTES
mmetsp:Transcript_7577/g.22349  ORF Transcript_7577/g.22349 Transcript_7577/m.22349 type:complete len:113 (+) Transcript_7577:225-563(+)